MKRQCLEGGTRVPVIVRWPKGITRAETSDVLISQIDWFASMASFINVRLPKGAAPDSYNRLGNLLGQDKEDRPWLIEQAANNSLSVRTKDWKLIDGTDGPRMIPWGPKIETGYSPTPQLYKMNEAGEQTNIAEQYPEKVFELQRILRKVRNKTLSLSPSSL